MSIQERCMFCGCRDDGGYHEPDCPERCPPPIARYVGRTYDGPPVEELLPFMPAPLVEPGATLSLLIMVQRPTKALAMRVSYATRAAFSTRPLQAGSVRGSLDWVFVPLDLRTPTLLPTDPDTPEQLCVWEGALEVPALMVGQAFALDVRNDGPVAMAPAIVLRAKVLP